MTSGEQFVTTIGVLPMVMSSASEHQIFLEHDF